MKQRGSSTSRRGGLRCTEQRGMEEGIPVRAEVNSGQNHDRGSSSLARTSAIDEKEIFQLKQEMALVYREVQRLQNAQSNPKVYGFPTHLDFFF